MHTRKIITHASTVTLLLAATSGLADTSTTHQTHKKQAPQRHAVVQKKVNLTTKQIPAPQVSQAPKPVNLAHKYFGLGPQSRIQINGFMSAGLSASTANGDVKYDIPGHGAIGNNVGFAANSLAGLQVTGNISKKLSAVVQITATGDDTNGNKEYRPNVDWAFIRYKMNPNWQFRVGRMRLPAFLYSQTAEVGATYVPVFLPPEVYRLVPFYNFNGMDLTYSANLGNSDWTLSVNPIFGENTSYFDLYTSPIPNPKLGSIQIPYGTTGTFHENYIYGGAINVGNQYVTFHASYLRTKLSMDLPSFNDILPNGAVVVIPSKKNVFTNKSASFYSFGAKTDYHNFVASAEFAHRDTPDTIASLSAYYGLLGYRIDKFLPYVSYGRLWTTNLNKIKGPGSELQQAQESISVGTDYYITHNLVAKVGVSRITPLDDTKGLFTPGLNKNHVMLYSASLDIVF